MIGQTLPKFFNATLDVKLLKTRLLPESHGKDFLMFEMETETVLNFPLLNFQRVLHDIFIGKKWNEMSS